MSESSTHGCSEYRALSRRRFVAAAAAAATAPAWLPRVSLAKSYRTGQRDVMISIFLRGAADGLSICVPFSESAYYTARPRLAVPRPDSGQSGRATDLGVTVAGPSGSVGFGLPPGMMPLMPAFQAGHLLFVHACGSTDPTRSHFDAQAYMELGKPRDVTVATGWLARHLALTSPMTASPQLRAIALDPTMPITLQNGPLTLSVADIASVAISGRAAYEPRRLAALRAMYQAASEPTRSMGLNSMATVSLLNQINIGSYVPAGNAVYPATRFGSALRSAAALIKAQVGVEAIAMDYGDWDTHDNQGTSQSGAVFNLMNGLSTALAAFHTDMFTGSGPTFTLACMSEFGRRLAENANQGTDHGHGNVMMLMGSAVRGRRVMAQWPGLAESQLFQGIDLQVTTDYRDILAEVAALRLGNTDLPTLFPGYTPTFRGVMA